jgi:hypothetical protein
MKKMLLISSALAMIGAVQVAEASVTTYNVKETFFEPDTQPRDSIFTGSFNYDNVGHTVTNLHGLLSESMSGNNASDMAWVTLNNQLASWYDGGLGGTFAATFRNTNTNTFSTMLGGDGWSPQSGVNAGGVYYGFPTPANNPQNAYALIFIPDNPLAALNQSQINKLAYADCVGLSGPGGVNGGGMMGAVCMTGTSEAGYGSVGTMSGYPVSQTITLAAAPVPEPETYAMLMAGLGLTGFIARRRRKTS